MADNASTSLDRTLVQGIAWTGAIRWTVQTISWCATFVIAPLASLVYSTEKSASVGVSIPLGKLLGK